MVVGRGQSLKVLGPAVLKNVCVCVCVCVCVYVYVYIYIFSS